MPDEGARSPPHWCGVGENRAEEPRRTVYFVPLYAVAIVDPSRHVDKSGLPLDHHRQGHVGRSENTAAGRQVSPQRGFGRETTEPGVVVEQKGQKLTGMRKRGQIPEDDDEDDPHKPTFKRMRNRIYAQKSRDKKKAYVNALEYKVKELEKMNVELEEKCLALQNENEALKNEVLAKNPHAEEELVCYYGNLKKDKLNIEKSAEKQGNGPLKSADSQEATLENSTEITDHEGTSEIEIEEECVLETDQ